MHPIIAKTFGGLSASYYMRHFIFGLAFPVFIILMLSKSQNSQTFHFSTLVFLVVNTLLYSYSRFVYESIMKFILGKNIFFVNAFLMLGAKLMTMMLCWAFAIFVAPIGLAYLYFYHSSVSN